MEKTIFEKIVDREIPSYVVWENNNYMAFLDIHPHLTGQTLVIPKKYIGGYLFDLDNDQYTELLKTAKEVAKLLKAKLKCYKVLMLVEGLEVEHVHIKLYPATKEFRLAQSEPIDIPQSELEQTHRLITE